MAEILEALDRHIQVVGAAQARLATWRKGGVRAQEFCASAESLALELHVTSGDVAHPRFTEFVRPGRKVGGDNPGTWYHTALLDPSGVYEITATRGTSLYVGVQVYTTSGGWNLPAEGIGGEQIIFDDDGRFRVLLGGDKPSDGTNWVSLGPDDRSVIVRQYHRDATTP